MKHYVRESWSIGKNARYVRYYKPGEYAVITVLSYIFAGILLVPLMLIYMLGIGIYKGIMILYELIIKGIIGIVLILRKTLIIAIRKNKAETEMENNPEVKTYKDYADRITPVVKKISKVLTIISIVCAVFTGMFAITKYNEEKRKISTENKPTVTETKDKNKDKDNSTREKKDSGKNKSSEKSKKKKK